jgi:cytochrome P450
MISVDLQRGPLAGVWRDNPCGVLFELAQRAPGASARLTLGHETMLLFQDAGAAMHVARTRPDNYLKHFGSFAGFFGKSRITADGEKWRVLQRLSQPFINAAAPSEVVAAARRNFGAAADAMLASAGGAVAVDGHLNRAAAAVVSEVTLGFAPEAFTPTLFEDFRAILSYASVVTWNVAGASARQDAGLAAQASAARQRLSVALGQLVAMRAGRPDEPGMLEALAAAVADPEIDIDLLGEVCSLVFAGFDTTSAALGWAMWLLSAAPGLQQKLRAEIRAARAEAPDDDLAAIALMPGLQAFQNEALRIFPPIPILGRRAVEADRIGETDVAPGQIVLISIIGLHHDPKAFPGPRRVALDRFADGAPGRDMAGQFIPFGLGRRICGGLRLANIELTAALALLIDRLEIAAPPPAPLLFDWQASLRRRGGQSFLLRPAP